MRKTKICPDKSVFLDMLDLGKLEILIITDHQKAFLIGDLIKFVDNKGSTVGIFFSRDQESICYGLNSIGNGIGETGPAPGNNLRNTWQTVSGSTGSGNGAVYEVLH